METNKDLTEGKGADEHKIFNLTDVDLTKELYTSSRTPEERNENDKQKIEIAKKLFGHLNLEKDELLILGNYLRFVEFWRQLFADGDAKGKGECNIEFLIDLLPRSFFSGTEAKGYKIMEILESVFPALLNDPSYINAIAKCYYLTGHNEKALDLYNRAIELKPGRYRLYMGRAIVKKEMGDPTYVDDLIEVHLLMSASIINYISPLDDYTDHL